MIELDAIDRQILELLQQDGRLTNLDLARQIGLTPAPTLARVKKHFERLSASDYEPSSLPLPPWFVGEIIG